jgi:general secretion pathway protein F
MPQFQYSAKEGPHKIVHNILSAESYDQAVKKIMQLGLVPLEIKIAQQAEVQTRNPIFSSPKAFFARVRLVDLTTLTRQISDLIEASVPILRTLQLVSNQTQNARLKEILEEITVSVRDGLSFSSALSRYPEVFSPLYINMVKTGEVSGKLNLVMNRLADYLEKERETRGKVMASLAYPILIMSVGAITIFVLLTFVIPRLSVMFDDFDQKLPLITILLVNVSGVFAKFGWVMVLVVVGGSFYLNRYIHTSMGKERWDRFLLSVPFLKDFLQTVEVGRFSRTLGTLVENGVPITLALNSVMHTVDNLVFKDEIKKIAEEVTNGRSLRSSLKNSRFFPERVINMISVGEETGQMSKGLNKVAETFERESDQIVKTIISLLGPIVLVIIVSIIGCVVIALLLPILQMNTIV